MAQKGLNQSNKLHAQAQHGFPAHVRDTSLYGVFIVLSTCRAGEIQLIFDASIGSFDEVCIIHEEMKGRQSESNSTTSSLFQ